jgi:protein-S-isoprenylcysteine O-methyltransferase Ste14
MTGLPSESANVRIHPPVLMLIHLVAAFGLGWLFPIPLPPWVKYLGWVVVLAGWVVAFGGLRQLISAHTSPDPHAPTTSVVTTGVYRFTRNPIYFGFLCLVIGLPLIFGIPWGLVVAPVQVYFFNRSIITREETYLAGKFGQEYLDYKSRVRRWV